MYRAPLREIRFVMHELLGATDRLIDSCIDKPAEKVLGVLEQVRAVRQ